MIVLLPFGFFGVAFVYGMESFEIFAPHHEQIEQSYNSLKFFGEVSQATISDALKSKRDEEGNSLLHVLAALPRSDGNFMQSLVIDHQFSVIAENDRGEDVWIHGLRYHKNDPHFFQHFDLLYHGPTKIQWQALCGETVAVHDALDSNSESLSESDQRGFPLIYYAWRHKTLLKQLLEKKALVEPKLYKKVIDMWLFRGQQEAKCGRVVEHKKMCAAIAIVFDFSKDLLSQYADQFAYRAAYVGRGILETVLDRLVARDMQGGQAVVEKMACRVKVERKKPLNTYYSAILQETYTYLADA